jgi:hypothetical protein
MLRYDKKKTILDSVNHESAKLIQNKARNRKFSDHTVTVLVKYEN